MIPLDTVGNLIEANQEVDAANLTSQGKQLTLREQNCSSARGDGQNLTRS